MSVVVPCWSPPLHGYCRSPCWSVPTNCFPPSPVPSPLLTSRAYTVTSGRRTLDSQLSPASLPHSDVVLRPLPDPYFLLFALSFLCLFITPLIAIKFFLPFFVFPHAWPKSDHLCFLLRAPLCQIHRTRLRTVPGPPVFPGGSVF